MSANTSNTMPCPNCTKVISVNSKGAMAKHQKTKTCQNYKKQAQPIKPKTIPVVPLPTEASLSPKESKALSPNWKNPHSPFCNCTVERLDNYSLWFEEGSDHFGKCLYQAVDELRKPLTWSTVESEVVIKSKPPPEEGTEVVLDLLAKIKELEQKNEELEDENQIKTEQLKHLTLSSSSTEWKPIEVDFVIEDYTTKSFVVKGNTKEYKEILKKLGGKWNANLTDKESGSRFGGWIFSNNKKKVVEEYIFQK